MHLLRVIRVSPSCNFGRTLSNYICFLGAKCQTQESETLKDKRLVWSDELALRTGDTCDMARHCERGTDILCASGESRFGSTDLITGRTSVNDSEKLMMRWRKTLCCRGKV